jgi:uncharacterized protein
MRKIWIGVAAATALTALGGAAQAASFDCNRARTADEKAICANRPLNDKDVRMVLLFDITQRLVPMGSRDAIRDSQRAWLVQRRTCGASLACLNTAYDRRIAALNRVMDRVYSAGPF